MMTDDNSVLYLVMSTGDCLMEWFGSKIIGNADIFHPEASFSERTMRCLTKSIYSRVQ